MARGILATVQLAVALAFAIPLAVFGISFLLRGRLLIGGTALGAAGLMLLVEEYLTAPTDIPAKAAETAAAVLDRTADPWARGHGSGTRQETGRDDDPGA